MFDADVWPNVKTFIETLASQVGQAALKSAVASLPLLASGGGTAGGLTVTALSGAGASCSIGSGGAGRLAGNSSINAGNAATGYCSGGSGAAADFSVSTAAGGVGTAGYVIIREYP